MIDDHATFRPSGFRPTLRSFALACAVAGSCAGVRAIDLVPLWNFGDPAASEQRFKAALSNASGDDALILQTQIARTHGMRNDFETARRILREIEPRIATAGAEARIRHALETGRTYASAAHAPQAQTDDAKERARTSFLAAYEAAKVAHQDGLAVDALHMMAFVDTAPIDQLKWGQQALALAERSSQPAARAWEASLRNNVGHALHQLGRYEDALVEFRRAIVLREKGSNAEALGAARWMEAWTLRALGRVDDALAIQHRLEADGAATGASNRYVFEELELLYRAKGDTERAADYARRKAGAR
jgi:tetratricopeptide (TPR) repeat protein